jgi:hypothetical protein
LWLLVAFQGQWCSEKSYLKVACFQTANSQSFIAERTAGREVSKVAIAGEESDDQGGQIEGATLLAHWAHSFSFHIEGSMLDDVAEAKDGFVRWRYRLKG